MNNRLTRAELIELVRKIKEFHGPINSAHDYQIEWLEILKQNVPDPCVANYIFWSRDYTSPSRELTPEEIVDKALSYKPIIIEPK